MAETDSRKTEAIIEKVKLAMLTRQRYAWEQGVAAQALLELGESDLVILMAKEAVLRQALDGRLGVVGDDVAVTDPAVNGEAVLFAAQATGDASLRAAADRMLDYLLHHAPKTEDGILCHTTSRPWVWSDSAYMAPPFLAVAGHAHEAVRQLEGFRKLLFDPQKQLYSHMWDEGRKVFQRRACWGVGNGWTAAGITRVIRTLPPDMAVERRRLIGYAREVIDGCLAHRRDDGLFHDVVDDPTTFVETNLAQMLAYSIYRGIAGGWLDATYGQLADRMREAAYQKVDEYGLVQDVCGSPHFDRPGTATEGQAFFLLMEAAARDLCVKNQGTDIERR